MIKANGLYRVDIRLWVLRVAESMEKGSGPRLVSAGEITIPVGDGPESVDEILRFLETLSKNSDHLA